MFDKLNRIYVVRYDSKENMDKGLSLINKMRENGSEFFYKINNASVSVTEENTVLVLCEQYPSYVRSFEIYLNANKNLLGIKDFESKTMY